jgi:thioester reductase-like protein
MSLDNHSKRDLRREVALDACIQPTNAAQPPDDSSARTTLLTGATGFVGAHVLRTLLDRRLGTVFCLVRGPTAAAAKERILRNLDRYQLPRPSSSDAVVAINGDLALPGFGLAPGQFDDLASRVDVVVHNGAWVHLTHSYETLRPVNVLGTHEILRFAVARRTKRICHVSGLSVYLGVGEARENAPPPYVAAERGGYFDTKWVSEKLVWEALNRGAPGYIVRLGWISGDTRLGLISKSDAMTMFIRACVRLGAAPRLAGGSLKFTPVDIAAQAIVHAAMTPPADSSACNLYATHTIPEEALWKRLGVLGATIELLPSATWLQMLQNRFPLMMAALHRHYPLVMALELDERRENSVPPIEDALGQALVGSAVQRPTTIEELQRVYICSWLQEGRPIPAIELGGHPVSSPSERSRA